MPITLDNYNDYKIDLVAGGVTIPFFVFNGADLALARPRIEALAPVFARMPPSHLRAIHPVLILPGRLPSVGHGGGTPGNPAAAVRGHAADLGTSPEVALRIAEEFRGARAVATFHWIPPEVWTVERRFPITVRHEAVHGIDMNLRLSARGPVNAATAARLGIPQSVARQYTNHDFFQDLPGEQPPPGFACGVRNEHQRAPLEAYELLLRDLIRGDRARRRVAAELSVSRSFESVPASWWEANFPGLLPRA